MKKHTYEPKQIRCILAATLVVIAVAIVVDALNVPESVSQKTAQEVLLLDQLTETDSPSTSAPDTAAVTTDTAADSNDTSAPVTKTETAESTAPAVENPVKPDDGSVTITFTGFCAPGSPLGTSSYGSLNALAQTEGTSYFLAGLADILKTDDLTVSLNRCAFTNESTASSLSCSAPVSQAALYRDGSVEVVSLAGAANSDFSDAIQNQTKESLVECDTNCIAEGETAYFTLDSIRLAIYSPSITKGQDVSGNLAAIRAACQAADYVVVYYWSDTTDSSTPDEWIQYTLRQFADAGASLIIGCGSSVLQPIEKYNGTTIVYSLGALIDGATFRAENASALLRLTLTLGQDETITDTITLLPCSTSLSRWQPSLVSDSEEQNRIQSLLTGDTDLPLMNQ